MLAAGGSGRRRAALQNAYTEGGGSLFPSKGDIMGKYFIAWLLGVPAVVLVIVWLLFGR